MPKVTYIEFNGAEHVVDVPEGENVMRGALYNGVEGITGECGGGLSCATCHCYVDEAWTAKVGGPSSQAEAELLENAAAGDARQTSSGARAAAPSLAPMRPPNGLALNRLALCSRPARSFRMGGSPGDGSKCGHFIVVFRGLSKQMRQWPPAFAFHQGLRPMKGACATRCVEK